MIERVVSKLDFSRRWLLSVVGLFLTMPVVFGLMLPAQSWAQATANNTAQDIAGTWQGTLHAPARDLRIVVKISKADGAGWKAVFYSIDQGGQGIPASAVTLQDSDLKISMLGIGGSYEGKLSADGASITGTWIQGAQPMPLNLARATGETAWDIPEPPKPLPPMAADANPSFEVATIKPSNPDDRRFGIIVRGRQLSTYSTTLSDVIQFSYGVQARQIVGAPDWLDKNKYDITGQPDRAGQPNDKQWKLMLQKLLADRFQLKFHRDKQELSAYALVVTKDGSKLTKSVRDPNGLPGLGLRGLGKLVVVNANMEDFTGFLQQVVVDRPVVDQTGLQGRFDFSLNWTPDASEFHGRFTNLPPSTDPNPPPGVFTAIQEQLGLKLEATKAPVEVLVIDHVEQPSAN